MVAIIATTLALIHSLLSIVSEAHSWIDCIDTKRSTVYDESVSYIFGGGQWRRKMSRIWRILPGSRQW
ncbi:unnamed protein product [Peronospora effusa]|nr:unnamed protein product [Peronospora effusa]